MTGTRIVPLMKGNVMVTHSRSRTQKNQPEKTFRLGLISATVWLNEIDTEDGSAEIRNVTLQRRYRDGDEWKSSSSLGVQDLPQAIRVLQLAQQYIEPLEAELS
jgi:hypothetical protein